MTEDIQKHKEKSLELCRKLLQKLDENDDDASLFFGADFRKSYIDVTDMAKTKVKNIQTQITNL